MPRIKSSTKASLKPLIQARDRLNEQMITHWEKAEALRNQIAGLEKAIEIIEQGSQSQQVVPDTTTPASSVKSLLLDLARDAGVAGLNANIAVEMASKQGITLKRGTAASNLSRLKTDKALIHDGNRYRLPEFVRPQLALHTGGKGS
jgi:hypothetical protein